jgi:hypothetical protein
VLAGVEKKPAVSAETERLKALLIEVKLSPSGRTTHSVLLSSSAERLFQK